MTKSIDNLIVSAAIAKKFYDFFLAGKVHWQIKHKYINNIRCLLVYLWDKLACGILYWDKVTFICDFLQGVYACELSM